MIEEKFEVIRNKEEHENNGGVEYARLYCYYRQMGCSKEDSRKYAKWTYQNRVKKNE